MVAYECLTGSLPFAGTAVEIALAHQHQSLPPLPAAVPRELVELIAFLTARDPARRPASARVVAARARALADTISGSLPGAGSQGADAGLSGNDGWAPSRPSEMPDRTLTDIPYAGSWDAIGLAGGHDGRGLPPLARRPRATASGSAPPPGHAPRSHGSKAAARTVTVDAAALLGQPVSAVVSQLRQLGLQVVMAWQPGHDQKPGTVLSVQPSGNVLAGTTVVVTATQPNGDHHHDHGNSNGQGGD